MELTPDMSRTGNTYGKAWLQKHMTCSIANRTSKSYATCKDMLRARPRKAVEAGCFLGDKGSEIDRSFKGGAGQRTSEGLLLWWPFGWAGEQQRNLRSNH